MADPDYILVRGRNVAREALIVEIIASKMATMAELSTIDHDATADELRRIGLPVPPEEKASMQRLSMLQLEYMLAFVENRLTLVNTGIATDGIVRDGTVGTGGDPYSARNGELILCDGTTPFSVVLPDPTVLSNEKNVNTVKMITGGGPITITADGGALLDGNPTSTINFLNVANTYVVVNGEYQIL